MIDPMLKKILRILDEVQAMSPEERKKFDQEGMTRANDVLSRKYHEDRDFHIIGEELFDPESVFYGTIQYQIIEEKEYSVMETNANPALEKKIIPVAA